MAGNEIFTFTWHIENFSMCPQQTGKEIISPTFKVDFLEKTEWRIILYPRGHNVENLMACALLRTFDDDYTEPVTIGFTLTVFSVHINGVIKSECASYTFGENKRSSIYDLIHRSDIFNSANGMLPNGTLIIKCYMWRSTTETNASITEIPNINNYCDSEEYSKINHYSAVTRIKMRSKSLLYTIKRFSVLRPDVMLTRNMESPAEDGILIHIAFCLKGETVDDQFARIDISITDTKHRNIFVRGGIKTLGSPKSIQLQGEDEHYFQGGGRTPIWRFLPLLKIKDLMEGKYLSYTDDTLYLYCEFCYSIEGEECTVKNENTEFSLYTSANSSCLSCPKHEYLSLYRSGKFSDVTIQAGTSSFKAHKNILSLKSDVFEVMFESDMQEKANGVVDITDFDSDTVNRMLLFLYSDSLQEMNQENVVKLYAIADKYNVTSLKCQCCCILIATLSASNICEVLTFADLYQDEDLVEAVRCFISINANETFRSQKWKDLVKTNAALAADVMLHVLTKNFLT